MPTQDARIRFPAARVDFVNDVGETSQPHDQYPAPGQQARYDWLRLYLIGLLSNQASALEPTNYREGSLWFDTSIDLSDIIPPATFRVRKNNNWVSLSEAINLGTSTLQAWYEETVSSLSSIAPELFYAGVAKNAGSSDIPIPPTIGTYVTSDTRAFVVINGEGSNRLGASTIIVDPRRVSVFNTHITLQDFQLEADDKFTVTLRRIPSATFYQPNVIVN